MNEKKKQKRARKWLFCLQFSVLWHVTVDNHVKTSINKNCTDSQWFFDWFPLRSFTLNVISVQHKYSSNEFFCEFVIPEMRKRKITESFSRCILVNDPNIDGIGYSWYSNLQVLRYLLVISGSIWFKKLTSMKWF